MRTFVERFMALPGLMLFTLIQTPGHRVSLNKTCLDRLSRAQHTFLQQDYAGYLSGCCGRCIRLCIATAKRAAAAQVIHSIVETLTNLTE